MSAKGPRIRCYGVIRSITSGVTGGGSGPISRSAGQRLPGLPEARGVVTAQLEHGLPLFDAVAGFGQANDPGSRADGVLFAGPACAEKPRGAADRKSVEPAEPA